MTGVDRRAAADAAMAAADAARREILPRFRRTTVDHKADGSPVTEADLAAERAIRAVLREATPDVAIRGEEYGEESGSVEGRAWCVDPIDGTFAFSRGLPLFGTIIALLEDGEPTVGLIDLPAIDERYVGWLGGGAYCNGEPVRVSQRADLDTAIVAHGDVYTFDDFGERGAFERLVADVPRLRGYTDAFGHGQVLRGAVDAMVDLSLSQWDVAATEILVPEAGGRCVRLQRDGLSRDIGVVFGSPALVDKLLDYLTAP